jgi:hypothetical protein
MSRWILAMDAVSPASWTARAHATVCRQLGLRRWRRATHGRLPCRSLRRKLGDDVVRTVYGVGYALGVEER